MKGVIGQQISCLTVIVVHSDHASHAPQSLSDNYNSNTIILHALVVFQNLPSCRVCLETTPVNGPLPAEL